MKLSYEPAVTATLTAGLGTAVAVRAFLNAADMPPGWDWLETWLPVGIFVVYAVVGLVIRPLVIPTAKAADAAKAERLAPVHPSHVHKVGGHPGSRSGLLPPPSTRGVHVEHHPDD